MPVDVDRFKLVRLLQSGAQLLEVLPTEEYNEEHLPGAAHIPLRKLTRETTAKLDRDRPIVTYCYDYQ